MPSAQPSKKRKQTQEFQDSQSVPKKKAKHDAVSHLSNGISQASGTENDKNSKGKGKETAFQVIQASLVVSISPVFANNPRAGVEEMLDSMIMRYIPALDGVVLSHSNILFKEDTAAVQADCPFLVCKIIFDATVWRPLVGMKLVGKISLCSPDHISLLMHKTFNISIPRHHIPTEEWEFEYGAAENDPEFGAGAKNMIPGETEGEGSGRWIHRVTASSIGGEDGYLEFTVIGLTIANEMLSLIGSLQRDPFSAVHVPSNGVLYSKEGVEEEEEQVMVDELLNDVNDEEGGDNNDGGLRSDQDGFEALNQKQNDANDERSRQTVAEEKQQKPTKKKKRKVEEDSEAGRQENHRMEKKKKKTGKLKS